MTPDMEDIDEVFEEELSSTDEESAQRQQEERMSALNVLSLGLTRERDEWISARQGSGIDRRWQEDLDMYNSRDPGARMNSEMMDSVEAGYPVGTPSTGDKKKPTRSTVFIGLTRNKTNAGEARLSDIVIPTGEKNWGIRSTPRPALSQRMSDERPASPAEVQAAQRQGLEIQPAGKSVTEGADAMPAGAASGQPTGVDGAVIRVRDIAAAAIAVAKKAAHAMEELINDQLVESDYNAEQRRVIHWAAVLGTGVMKGPVAANRYRKAWVMGQDGTWSMSWDERVRPISISVDPRNVFPDPSAGEQPSRGAAIWERADMTEREVRDLVGGGKMGPQPGYIVEQVERVLEAGPKSSAIYRSVADQDRTKIQSKTYERWERWGQITLKELWACGVKIPGYEEGAEGVSPERAFASVVIIINDMVVKAFLNPLESGDIPYDFFVWERVADSPWGQGVPRLMNSQQRVLNAAWRMMMDNAGLSAGPQIVINTSLIEPADQRWEMTGRKVWRTKTNVDDIRKAFDVFNIDSNQQGFQAIIEMALNLVDDDTQLPRLVQGERGNAPDTVGGMQMLMNSTNVVLRRQVKRWDDDITRPHITRYYDFNMEHSEDPSVKGDFEVDARGSSSLLVRDIENQALLQLLTAYFANPMLKAVVKFKELLKRALRAQHIDIDAILYSDDEIETRMKEMEQSAPADPRIEAAKIQAQAQLEAAQARAAGEQSEIQLRQQIADQNQEYRLAELTLRRDLAILDMAEKRNLTVEQIKADLAKTAISERSKKELFTAERNLKLDPANPSGLGI